MEQFSLEKYLANPSRKVVTRDGRNARIICTDREDLNFPIITLIKKKFGGEVIYAHTKDGLYCNTCSTIHDLFFAPKKHEGWINVYRNNDSYTYAGAVYNSKEDAEKRTIMDENYVTSIKIEWEE